MKKTIVIMLAAGLMIASCGEKKETNATEPVATESNEEVETTEVAEVETPNIVGVAVGNENFSTLVAAVKAADLVETLSGDGPFTVFAPTNDAFAKLPEGTINTLLKPESKATLTGILTYHVVAGKFMAADVVAAIKANNGTFTANTVQGEKISLMMDGNNVVIKDAKGGKSVIIMTDVPASNGVIHAIDTVIMPKG
ncbi:fasciclin domain-containing protein [uncultured Dokdonia sp.]|uniref:fasciclin domain-containing protein n=1 Tax=uncultured Dokdonia sp. TaxID=575653 RepID=UPI00260D4CAE|nr:fasciclin domain-containing protein [uncultured Dokdonia sp.]